MSKLLFLRLGSAATLSLGGCSSPADSSAASDTSNLTASTSAPALPLLPADYESRSAEDKLSVLWDQRIVPSRYATLPPWPAVSLVKLTSLDLNVTLDRQDDMMPAGREKLVHALGTVAKVEYIADPNTPYTGMYQGGIGVVRLSLAHDPGKDAFIPGVALKLLADGQPSQNMEVMLSIDGQGANFDFFANTLSNIIPDPTGVAGKIVAGIFSKVSPTPGHLDVARFAETDRKGRATATPLAPAQVFFVPALSVKAVPRASSPTVDFRTDFDAIPEGSTLYDVFAARNLGDQPAHIGRLLTTSEMVSSQFGDAGLFFRHQAHGKK